MSKSPVYVTAREALALFMENNGLDDARMAGLVDMSRTGITKIRNDGRAPSLEVAARIEEVTGIPASAWRPASPEQGKVSPTWLKKLEPVKPAPKAKAKTPAVA